MYREIDDFHEHEQGGGHSTTDLKAYDLDIKEDSPTISYTPVTANVKNGIRGNLCDKVLEFCFAICL